MVTYPIVLGPEFDAFPDDTEESLVGSHAHKGAIVTVVGGLQICASRRDLPWFIGNQIFLLIPQEGLTPCWPSAIENWPSRLSGMPRWRPSCAACAATRPEPVSRRMTAGLPRRR